MFNDDSAAFGGTSPEPESQNTAESLLDGKALLH